MSEIARAIKDIAKTADEVYSLVARVTAVDESERTCDVQPLNGDAALFRVRLQSELSGALGIVAFPKEGSTVVVTFINKESAYVALCSEVTRIVITIGGLEIEAEDNRLTVTANQVDLAGAGGEPVPKGTTLNGNLNNLVTQIVTALTALSTYASAQAAASTGTLAPLAPGYTALGAAITPIIPAVNAVAAQFPQHLSQKTKTQ
jgi:hypothetical protein